MTPRFTTALFSLVSIALAGGCAKYEYQLADPPEFAQRIGRELRRIERDPLIYRLQTYENRLIMRVQNPTDEPIELLGHQSAVVAPDGQSHPLRSQTIMPNTFVKLIFPPLRPRAYYAEPTFGIGVQVSSQPLPPRDEGLAPDDRTSPIYADLYSEADPTYWEWPGQSTVRLTLVYQRTGKTSRDDFTFRRVKVN